MIKRYFLSKLVFLNLVGSLNYAQSNGIQNRDVAFSNYGLGIYSKSLDSTPQEFVLLDKKIGGIWPDRPQDTKANLGSEYTRFADFTGHLEKSGKIGHDTGLFDSFFMEQMNVLDLQQDDCFLNHLMVKNKFKEMLSSFGQLSMISLITRATTDKVCLQERQKAIQFLVNNLALCQKIEKAAATIKAQEKELFLLFSTDLDSSYNKFLTGYNHGSWLGEQGTSLDRHLLYNSMWRSMDLPKRFLIGSGLSMLTGGLIGGFVGQSLGVNLEMLLSEENRRGYERGKVPKVGAVVMAIAGTAVCYPLWNALAKKGKIQYGFLLNMSSGLAETFHILQDVYSGLQEHKSQIIGACSVAALEGLMTGEQSSNKSLKQLRDLLDDKNSLNKSEPWILRRGRPIAILNLASDCRSEIANALYEFGELEAYVAIANLYREHQTKDAHYCFVEYAHTHKPSMEMDNFWNPFINSNAVVPNTLSMGCGKHNSIVVTGPNAGGKTTILKALGYNILLAQTFGIAAASKCVMTPFSKVMCHLNITDNLAQGTSLFQEEVNHAKNLVTELSKLKAKEFAFIVMDEAFRGTGAAEGEDISWQFVSALCEYKTCLSVTATHYAKLGTLEGCGQKHVELIVNPDGTYERTFKLKDGASATNIAHQIVKENNVFFGKIFV